MPARTNGGSPPPSETYLRDLESQLVTEFGERNAQIEKFRRLRYMEEPVSIPDAYRVTTREVRTPIAREQLKRVIGSLVANEPAITVPPPSSSERARRNASKRATWTVAALRRMGDDASRDVFGMFIDALVADGAGVMKLVYLPDRWSGYPRRGDGGAEQAEAFNQRAARYKKSAPFPLAWRDVDLLTFYPLIGEDGMEACLEISERPKRLVMRRYGLVEDARTGRLTPAGDRTMRRSDDSGSTRPGTVRVVEYWDTEHFAYVVDGHLVHRGRHGYGRVPYELAYGDQTPSRDPAKAGVSMLASMQYLIPLLDRLLTMKQNAVYLYAYPTPKLTGFTAGESSLGDDGRPRAIEFRPGEIFPLYPGEDLNFLQWTGTPPDLDELIGLTRGMIDQSGVPSVLFGIAPGAQSSGYFLNQLINAARVSFQQVARHAEQALERIVALAWQLVERQVRETVYVYAGDAEGWIGLSPKDIDGYYAVRAKVEPLAPADEIAQGNLAGQLVASRLASRRWAMEEKLGVADVGEMQDEILIDELMDAPEVRRAIVSSALEALGAAAPGTVSPDGSDTEATVGPDDE